MTSVSFDPVAQQYDTSRGYPREVAGHLANCLKQAAEANANTRWFEVGVGTGRIAIPLASQSFIYTGIDISPEMLGVLAQKLRDDHWTEASAPWGTMQDEDRSQALGEVQHFIQTVGGDGTIRCLLADTTAIPFHAASFDVVIAAHVFHLIPEWKQALKEVLRVLKPGGILLRCWERGWEEQWKPGSGDIRRQWCTIVAELGGNTQFPGASDWEVTQWLQEEGLQPHEWESFSFPQITRPRTMLEELEQRLWTIARLLPDDIYVASLQRLRSSLPQATLDEPILKERHMVISKTQIA